MLEVYTLQQIPSDRVAAQNVLTPLSVADKLLLGGISRHPPCQVRALAVFHERGKVSVLRQSSSKVPSPGVLQVRGMVLVLDEIVKLVLWLCVDGLNMRQ